MSSFFSAPGINRMGSKIVSCQKWIYLVICRHYEGFGHIITDT